MAKMYFIKYQEDECYDMPTIKDMMKSDGISQMEVEEAEMSTGTGMFYCSALGEVGETSEGGCGKFCDKYKPRNGKSGRCRSHKNVYSPTGKVITVKI